MPLGQRPIVHQDFVVAQIISILFTLIQLPFRRPDLALFAGMILFYPIFYHIHIS
jgi:hypothetical protein